MPPKMGTFSIAGASKPVSRGSIPPEENLNVDTYKSGIKSSQNQ